MVLAKRLGDKTGRGVYEYPANGGTTHGKTHK
jgi:3-hydroxyacyl-CoA dehydrogenase